MPESSATTPPFQDRARELRREGVVYTPPPVARCLVRLALAELLAEHSSADTPQEGLDLACGAGAFLLEAVRPGLDPRGTITWAGVDLAAEALADCAERLAHSGVSHAVHPAVGAGTPLVFPRPRVTCVWGDALAGPAFGETEATADVPVSVGGIAPPVYWSRAFPEAAARGGFDVIVGNPPYRRERGSGLVARRAAASPLGRRWSQPRMDLWQYFCHRALDVLRPGGTLVLIVPSYWTKASSASRLLARLRDDTWLQDLVWLGAAPVFPQVSGRHLVFRLKRRGIGVSPPGDLRIWQLERASRRAVGHPELWEQLGSLLTARGSAAGSAQWDLPHGARVRCTIHSRSACDGAGLWLPDHAPYVVSLGSHASSGGTLPLERHFTVRQGIAENPPYLTRRHAEELGLERAGGRGVFVLCRAELDTLEFSEAERRLLRPYYETWQVGRYRMPATPDRWLLYLTAETAPDLAPYPRIARHLAPVRPILERRREVQRGLRGWWQLHWPRTEPLFTEPRGLGIQMVDRPQFVVADTPAFVGFAFHVLQPRAGSEWSLAALVALLNSAWAAAWFTREAKHRGVHLDIGGGVLRRFPLPPFERTLHDQLAACSTRRQMLETYDRGAAPADVEPHVRELEQTIDALVEASYGVDAS